MRSNNGKLNFEQSPRAHGTRAIVLLAGALAATACGSGTDGRDGLNGATGPVGATGARGSDGDSGAAGPTGATGAAGASGAAGDTGAVGATGAAGDPGATGPEGATGAMGSTGAQGAPGDAGDPGHDVDAVPGLYATLAVDAPANGEYYALGERIVFRAHVEDRWDTPYAPADLSGARLYVQGPGGATRTRSAVELLGASGVYPAGRGTHHYIELKTPPEGMLAIDADGTLVYTSNPVAETEDAGTYGVTFYVTRANGDALLLTRNIQIRTNEVDEDPLAVPADAVPAGAPAFSCTTCHWGAQAQRAYMHHIDPTIGRAGSPALDSAGPAGCRSCHNAAGYSRNPLVLKVHGAHRGAKLTRAGDTSPTTSFIDATKGDFNNNSAYQHVVFPVMPDGEKNCTVCHTTDAWKERPSRLACGSCHDNLNFATGALDPPRNLGKPSGVDCTNDLSCVPLGLSLTCDTETGDCLRVMHAPGGVSDDEACHACHGSTETGIAPISVSHAVAQKAYPGLVFDIESVTGGSGAGGAFRVGDRPTVTFTIKNRAGTALGTADLSRLYVMMSGPTQHMQRVIAQTQVNLGSLTTVDAAAGRFSHQLAAIPANTLTPYNALQAGVPLADGTYVISVHGDKTQADGARDAGFDTFSVLFGGATTLKPRAVVAAANCNKCHGSLQAHGGGRRGGPEICIQCHTVGSVDRTSTERGLTETECTDNSVCASTHTCIDHDGDGDTAMRCVDKGAIFASNDCADDTKCKAHESCIDHDTNAGTSKKCVATEDPSGDASIDMQVMVHKIHFGRYLKQRPYEIMAFNNTLIDMSDVIFPVDVRNCETCHLPGTWKATDDPQVCTSCHDSTAAQAHVAQNTPQFEGNPVPTCTVCHGPDREFSVEKSHALNSPWVPPYVREPSEE